MNENANIIKAIGDGNCGFNAFALGLIDTVLAGKLDKPIYKNTRKHLLTLFSEVANFQTDSWDQLKASLDAHKKSNPSLESLQKELAKKMRAQVIKLFSANPGSPHCRTLLTDLFSQLDTPVNSSPDKIINKHEYAFFKEYYDSHLKRLSNSDERNKRFIAWWESAGYKQYIEKMKAEGTWVTNMELSFVAIWLGIGLTFYTKNQANGFQVLAGRGVDITKVVDINSIHINKQEADSLSVNGGPFEESLSDEEEEKRFRDFDSEDELSKSIGNKLDEKKKKQVVDTWNNKEQHKDVAINLLFDGAHFDYLQLDKPYKNSDNQNTTNQTVESTVNGKKLNPELINEYIKGLCKSGTLFSYHGTSQKYDGFTRLCAMSEINSNSSIDVIYEDNGNLCLTTKNNSYESLKMIIKTQADLIKKFHLPKELIITASSPQNKQMMVELCKNYGIAVVDKFSTNLTSKKSINTRDETKKDDPNLPAISSRPSH